MPDNLVLGIDIGGTKILALVAKPSGDIIASEVAETPRTDSADIIIAAMADIARAAIASAGVDPAGIRAAGVAAAGVAAAGAIDAKEGVIVHSPHIKAMSNTPVAPMLAQRLGAPVVIGNDANLAALGEQRYGAGVGAQNLVFLTISTGIGAGIIINGRLYTGAAGYAGEVGHMTVDARGPYGLSLTPGAWESLCAGVALARIAAERIAAGEPSSLTAHSHDTSKAPLSAHDIFAAQRAGDPLARSIIDNAIIYLGGGLTSIVNLLNPEKLIIGGGLSNEWDAYIAPAIALMREQSFAGIGKLTPVVPPALGVDAGALGAVALASDSL